MGRCGRLLGQSISCILVLLLWGEWGEVFLVLVCYCRSVRLSFGILMLYLCSVSSGKFEHSCLFENPTISDLEIPFLGLDPAISEILTLKGEMGDVLIDSFEVLRTEISVLGGFRGH